MAEIASDSNLDLQIAVTGMHLSPSFGNTVCEVLNAGFNPTCSVESLVSSDTGIGMAKSLALGISGLAEALSKIKPDIVVVMGDRVEILAAALAATFVRIPIAHVSGGEVTEGAIDDSIRHAITKLSQFHYVATEQYRHRVIQLGEAPERVLALGDPGLDDLFTDTVPSRDVVESQLGFVLGNPTFLVTYHPVTLGSLSPETGFGELTAALDFFPEARVVFTKPNSDPGGLVLSSLVDLYASRYPARVRVATSLGRNLYLGVMKYCTVVIGNSSSAIIEAPAMKKAAVNIGERQKGRLKATSVIDCDEDRNRIREAIIRALSAEFQGEIPDTKSLYGEGGASHRIKEHLKAVHLDTRKSFYDVPDPS
jgi:UDP-hydrolysing UDP-N-acetyl-D-glucosamine 2-epimerase